MTQAPDAKTELDALLTLDGGAGPAVPLSDEQANAMVDATLERWQHGNGSPEGGAAPRGKGFGSSRRVLAITGAVAIGSALLWYGSRRSDRVQPAPRAHAPRTLEGAPQPAAPAQGEASAEAEARAETQRPAETEPSSPAQVTIPPTIIEAGVPRRVEDLLRKANMLRSRRQWRDALAVYEDVRSASPKSHAAYVATLAAASLRLEHLHDAPRALRLYRLALHQHSAGSLSEEAYYGVAECYRALRRPRDELRALRTFLAKHAGSPLATQAQARIAELSAVAPSGKRPR